MAIGTLNFSLPRPDFLNFGRTAVDGTDNELTLAITLGAVSATFSFFVGLRFRLTKSVAWKDTQSLTHSLTINYTVGQPIASRFGIPWQLTDPSPQRFWVAWKAGNPVVGGYAIPWRLTDVLDKTISSKWVLMTPLPTANSVRWDQGLRYSTTSSIFTQAGQPKNTTSGIPWQDGDTLRLAPSATWNFGIAIYDQYRVLWDHAIPAPLGSRGGTLIPPYLPGKQWGRLNFVCPAGSILNFGNACFGSAWLLVPIQRSYRVINSAGLIRVSDSADIPVSKLTIKLDWESWCWTLSADLLGQTAYETVPASPGLVQATINNFVWQFVVDDVNYQRSFGSFGGTLTGRSPIALLASPYLLTKSLRESSLKTAQQLTLQELPGGFSLSTDLPDWTVPANTFQYENLTPIEAINRITKSCGGRIYADKITQTVYATAKWPRMPWAWTAAADVTLPSSYTLKESLQSQSGYSYEAVMVSGGVNNGIIAICKRTGTGGLTHAPSVVDTLITHLDAAMPRAAQELADHWPMKHYTLELPLQATPEGAGLIEPGTVIDFSDGEDGWRGLVVSVLLSATANDTKQNLEVISP